jgi:hypothetical protein
LNHIGKTVEVEGKVFVEEGVKVINVKSYKILEKTESEFLKASVDFAFRFRS